MNSLALARTYLSSSAEFAANTAAIKSLLDKGQADSPEFQDLWKQRDEIYGRMISTFQTVRQLPSDQLAVAAHEIERIKNVQ